VLRNDLPQASTMVVAPRAPVRAATIALGATPPGAMLVARLAPGRVVQAHAATTASAGKGRGSAGGGRARGKRPVDAASAILGRSAARRDEVWARAADVLGVQRLAGLDEPEWLEGATAVEQALVASWSTEVHRRVTDAGDPERLSTALVWLTRHLRHTPHLRLLKQRGGVDDLAAAAYNERAFARFELFIREHGSVQAGRIGEVVTQSTIAGYVGALRSAASVLMGCDVTSREANTALSRLGKQMRLQEPPAEDRAYRRALRAHQVLAIANSSFDRSSHHGLTRWGVLRVGSAALLRPGEVGTVDGRNFLAMIGLHWGDECVQWVTPAETGWRNPGVYLSVVPIKNQGKVAKRWPIPIPALHPEGVTDDPLCPYSALAKLYLRDAAHLSAEERACTAIFRHESGKVWSTDDVSVAVKAGVTAIGLDPAEFGGVSLRISGATELRDKHGRQGMNIIISFGRWLSQDIGFIYSRVTANEQLEAMASAIEQASVPANVHPEVETVVTGWVQPAIRR
jgi:hypothetical protein